jgi:threonine 3-dehydrogenase
MDPHAPALSPRDTAVAVRGPATTTVALWEGGAVVRLVEEALPALAPGETLLRIRLATVCGSDRHTVAGRRTAPVPSILGHEGVGDVEAVGEGGARAHDGTRLEVGDRVVVGVTVPCGACDRCRAGRTAKCRTVRKVGHESFASAWPLSGTYARHLVVPAGATVVRVPDDVPDEVASPAACATATVLAALEAAGPVVGRRVLVSGAGMLGVTAVAAARHAGAASVVAVDPDEARRALACAFGADDAVAPGAPLPPCDVAVELSGASPAVEACIDALDVGGVLVLAGSVAPAPPVQLDAERVVRGWLTVTGVHNYEPRHLADAVDLLARTRRHVPWHDLVEAAVPLHEVGAVLAGAAPTRPRVAVRP